MMDKFDLPLYLKDGLGFLDIYLKSKSCEKLVQNMFHDAKNVLPKVLNVE